MLCEGGRGGGGVASRRWKVSRNVEEEAEVVGREVAAGHSEHVAASEASTQTRALTPCPPL